MVTIFNTTWGGSPLSLFTLLVVGGILLNLMLFLHSAFPIIQLDADSTQRPIILSASKNATLTPKMRLESLTTGQQQLKGKELFRRRPCRPHQHVFYLKTHKTGSTTMYSIFAEYSRTHDLLPLLPKTVHINQSPPFYKRQVRLAADDRGRIIDQKYDMVFNHQVYSPKILKYLHNDTVKITTIREPFEHFISSFRYFRHGLTYLRRIQSNDSLTEFLQHRDKYEVRGFKSYTNNRQMMDLGFDVTRSLNDTKFIKQCVDEIDKRFDLVLITDYFHHSLVIMKRFLHWSTQDILYFSKNTRNRKKYPSVPKNATEEMYRKIHATFSQGDIALYEHFLPIFKQRMEREIGLDEEVAEFEDILDKLNRFCRHDTKKGSRLQIPAGKWSDRIDLLPYKCKWLKKGEVRFTRFLQRRQAEVLSFANNPNISRH